MSSLRVAKVRELIKEEVSRIILRDLKDPRIGFVTVTKVDITPDLREAKIYVSLMGTEEEKKSSFVGLNSSLGFIRREIGQRIKMRYTPQVSLAIDTGADYAERIETLLHDVNDKNSL